MIGQEYKIALRRLLSQSKLSKRLAAALAGVCLLWPAGCCRHGVLLDFSIELNRVPWRTGCERCGGGGCCNASGDSPAACANCRRHSKSSELAGTPVEEAPGIGRFFPVPTKPVFSQSAVAVEEIPSPQARKVRRPRPIPPEPDDSDVNSVSIRRTSR